MLLVRCYDLTRVFPHRACRRWRYLICLRFDLLTLRVASCLLRGDRGAGAAARLRSILLPVSTLVYWVHVFSMHLGNSIIASFEFAYCHIRLRADDMLSYFAFSYAMSLAWGARA